MFPKVVPPGISEWLVNTWSFTPAFFDIIRTGRFLWISVYFTISEDTLRVADLSAATKQINHQLSMLFENCVCELIPSTDEMPKQSPRSGGMPG